MTLRSFSRQSLQLQFVALIGTFLVFCTIALVTMRSSLAEAQALEHARATAGTVEALGNWSSQYRGAWFLSEPMQAQVGDILDHGQAHTSVISPAANKASATVPSKGDVAQPDGDFHSKDPWHVQRTLSEVIERMGGGEQFRLTSDRLFDPRNPPNRFELTAIEHLRAEDHANAEYHEVSGDRLVYAKRVVVSATCLGCHDRAEKSPEKIRSKFTQGWGLKEGGFAGIVSVSVPIPASGAATVFQQMNWAAWFAVTGSLLTFGGLLYWLQVNVIHKAKVLKDYSQSLLDAKAGVKVARVDLDVDEHSSRNELHRLSVAIRALYRALLLAQADRV